MASFTSCLLSHKLNGKVQTAELREAAQEYERRGLDPQAAAIRAVEEKIELLQMEEKAIIAAVRSAYEGAGGKKKQAAEKIGKSEFTNSLSRDSSWVIKNKETGEVIMETFDRKKVDALNTDKYEAVPIAAHLAGINKQDATREEGKAAKPKTAPEPVAVDVEKPSNDAASEEKEGKKQAEPSTTEKTSEPAQSKDAGDGEVLGNVGKDAVPVETFYDLGEYRINGNKLLRGDKQIGDIKLEVEGGKTPHLVVRDIRINSKGKGTGTEVLRALMDKAAEHGMPVALTSEGMLGKQHQQRLRAYYKRLGFKKNSGADKVAGVREEFVWTPGDDQSDLGKAASPSNAAPFDQSIYDDIGQGKSATDILNRIATESDNALNREIAQALLDAGINPAIKQETAEGKRFTVGNAPQGYAFAAAYSPKTDTVMLFRAEEAERNAVHEFVHSGTFKAIRKGGQHALMMKQLYAYVKKSGKAGDAYGMSNLDEFTAEALSNPEFQAMLRKVTAMPEGSKFENAWNWFVDIVRRALGLPTKYTTALDQALRYGRGLMLENGDENTQGDLLGSVGDANRQDMPTRVEITSILKSHPFTKLKIKPKRMFVAGSFSTGTQRVDSDIDIIIEVPDGIDPIALQSEYRKRASDFFVKNNLRGVHDAAHPQWSGRRIDVYFVADAEAEANGRPIVEIDDVLGNVNRMPDWLKSLPKETQDAAKKAGIWQEQKPLKQRLKELRDKAVAEFQQGVVDQFAPLKELDERSYVLSRLTKSADAPLEAVLMYGKPFLNSAGAVDVNAEKGGLIAVLQQLQGEHDRFFAWIAGNRAAKLKLQGKENLFSDTDISALKNLSQGKLANGKDRSTLYNMVHQQFNGYSKSVLDIAEQAGIINGDDRAIWESDFYVPFYRVMEDQEFKGPKNVSGMVNQYAFKKLKGGTDNLNDLMQNTLRNWSHLLSASLKNQAATAAIESAVKAGIATEVSQKQKGSVSILGRSVQKIPKGKKYMEGGVEKVSDGSAEVETFGEKHYMIDDPFIMDAITSLEFAGFNNPVMKAMTKAKHYLTLGVTVSPTFKIRNLIRDQLAAVAVNPVSYNVMSNLVDGWKGTDKDSAQYAKMLTGGGLMRFGTFLEDDRAAHLKRLVNAGVDEKTILDSDNKAKAALAAAWDWWQEVGDRSENITRAAIYKQRYEQLVKDGKSEDEAHLLASFAARDSMDFSLQGKWGSIRFLTQLVPFMNARLQGLYKIGRDGVMPTGRMIAPRVFGDAKTGDKAKAMRFGAVVGAVSLASIALMLAYRDDEDYQEREEWDKDTYWWFKVGGTAYRIPKPFEVGAMGTIAERGLDTLLNGMDKPSRELFIERMWAMITQTFSMNPIPQLFKPMIDLYANTDSFTGRPIETPGMENLSKSERIGPNTSATAQFIGKATSKVGLSPAQVDFLVNGYFSWLGTHAVMTADFAMRPLMGLPEKPTRKWPDDYFILGDFAKGLPSNQSKYVTKFYEQAKEVQEAMADIRYYQSMGNLEKAMELKQENADKVKLAEMYSQAGRQIGEINKRIKLVQSRNLDPDVKREQIDRLNQQRNRLAKLIEERRLARQSAN
jgi:predicted nucleotidyltransferase